MASLGGDRLVGILSRGLAHRLGESTRKAAFVGATAIVIAVSTTSGAQADTCAPNAVFVTPGIFRAPPPPIPLGPAFSGGVAAADAIISSINTADTALLTQSTAFVSAPPNPKPDSPGGGVWVRGVGGNVDFKSSSTINFNVSGVSGSDACPTKFHQDFAGIQLGQDIAKLNVMGWNLHLGQTAGYLETHGSTGDIGFPFSTTTQVPFVGTYAVATNGNFFADALVRENWFETSLNSPAINLNGQKTDARGTSVAGSMGYHWDVPNSNWFYEPSIGLVWSHTSIDALNVTSGSGGPPPPCGGCSTVNGTLTFNGIDSLVGRVGLRAGTTMQSGNVVYQPFLAVSIWHEFDGNGQSNFNLCSSCFIAPASATASITTPNIGTYGQYSLGVNGQIVNTGWLGFARVDYRNGNRLEGWSGTGGIRYQYTPGAGPMDMAFAMVGSVDRAMAYAKATKAPVFATKAPPRVERPYNWTGWYVGAFGGADYGDSHMGFPAAGLAAGPKIAGALFGGTLGYNQQNGAWVWGIEGDAGWTNARGSLACAGAVAFPQPLFNTDCRDKADWLGTATGRLGYASGRTLYYVKGGAAWTHEGFSATCDQPVAGPPCTNPAGATFSQSSASDSRTGWTAGFGTEFGLTANWSAKGEVNYIDFGNRNLTAADGTVINAGMRITEAKIGVNYRVSP
jgi:outer membrane autotransporter protein